MTESKNWQLWNPLAAKVAALAAVGVTSGWPMVVKFPGLSKGGYKCPLPITNYKEINK